MRSTNPLKTILIVPSLILLTAASPIEAAMQQQNLTITATVALAGLAHLSRHLLRGPHNVQPEAHVQIAEDQDLSHEQSEPGTLNAPASQEFDQEGQEVASALVHALRSKDIAKIVVSYRNTFTIMQVHILDRRDGIAALCGNISPQHAKIARSLDVTDAKKDFHHLGGDENNPALIFTLADGERIRVNLPPDYIPESLYDPEEIYQDDQGGKIKFLRLEEEKPDEVMQRISHALDRIKTAAPVGHLD